MESKPLNPAVDKPPPYSIATAPTGNNAWQAPPGYQSGQYAGASCQQPAGCHPGNSASQPLPGYQGNQYTGASWQPPPGYYPAAATNHQAAYIPTYGSTQSTTVLMPEIILVGTCPACRDGVMEDDYTCLGLLCAILFFPFGIICCLLLKTRRCSNCGVYFG